ncbi:MAG: hypothetical protein ACK49E_15000, partial [Planctomyces sp.]
MDVQLVQDAYSNGTERREYFVEQVDYQNIARDWCTAPVVPWTSYHVWPDGTVRNIDASPAEGGQPVPEPESTLTFAQLTDDQRSVVLSFLGYKRLFTFQYSNTRSHQTVNGNTTIVPWAPLWRDDRLVTVNFPVPGLKDKFIRLPEGAREDLLRVVSQGFTSGTETVGSYRDRADVRYTQITSALTDLPPNIEDYDNTIIGWSVAAIPNATNPSGLRDAQREYQIRDDRLTSNTPILHPSVPLWYGGTTIEVGTDTKGWRATAPAGYIADSQQLTEQAVFEERPRILAGERRIPNIYSTSVSWSGGQAFTRIFVSVSPSPDYAWINAQRSYMVSHQPASAELRKLWRDKTGGGTDDPTLEFGYEWTHLYPPGYFENQSQASVSNTLISMGYSPADITDYVFSKRSLILRTVDFGGYFDLTRTGIIEEVRQFSTAVTVKVYETFTDYDFHWLGKWHDVIDRRDNFSFEWVTREEDVF